MGEQKKQYEVLFRKAPAWEVGQNTPGHRPGQHYPGDYAGRVTAVREIGKGPSLKNESDKDRPVVVLSLTEEEARALRDKESKILLGEPVPVDFNDRWGAIVPSLFGLEEDLNSPGAPGEIGIEAADRHMRASQIAHLLTRALPRVETHTGTGLYAAELVPSHNDDTQSGAPVGQVITLVTGGLGVADAWKGGYVTNATRAETRAIVSHTDDTVTLEGDLSAWLDTDDLDIYDSWSTVQGALDQLWTDQAAVEFTSVQEIRVGAGTFTRPLPNGSLLPTPEFYLYLHGESRTTSIIDVQATSLSWTNIERLHCESLGVIGTVWGYFWVSHLYAVDCDFYFVFGSYDCAMEFEDCLFDGNDSALSGAWHDYNGVSRMVFRRCHFQEAAHVTTRRSYGSIILLESCTSTSAGDALVIEYLSGYSGSERIEILNCAVYGSPLIHVEGQQVDFLRVRNTICSGGAYVYDLAYTPRYQMESDDNCFYNQSTAIANWGGADKTLAEWKALGYDEHTLDENPMFTDPASEDLSLQDGSPCEAVAPPCGVQDDFDGNPFRKTRCNMGAYAGTTTHQFGG